MKRRIPQIIAAIVILTASAATSVVVNGGVVVSFLIGLPFWIGLYLVWGLLEPTT